MEISKLLPYKAIGKVDMRFQQAANFTPFHFFFTICLMQYTPSAQSRRYGERVSDSTASGQGRSTGTLARPIVPWTVVTSRYPAPSRPVQSASYSPFYVLRHWITC